MTTDHVSTSGSISTPQGVRDNSAKKQPPKLWVWVSIAIAIATVVIVCVAQIVDTSPIELAVEIEPALLDPFNQRLHAADGVATENQAYLNNLWARMTR